MIGNILGKRYQIVEKIATGGMSSVYKALDLNLKRYDAIKILKEEYSQNPDFVEKFKQEANSVAGLNHPNIVNIYNVGSEGNLQYIVMEYVKGKNLKNVIRSKGRLFQDQVINYSEQIAKALSHAHTQGIIHRDIKPHNIMLTEDGRIKVTDFGIAKHSESSTITNSGRIIGSVHYFSPEQARGLTTDKRTDIYSLGIVMYEMITGRVPFDSESPVTVALKHMQEPIIPPKTINPQVSDKLNAVIMKATQKDPIDRYQTIDEMLTDIQKIRGTENLVYAVSEDEDSDHLGHTQVMAPIRTEGPVSGRKKIIPSTEDYEYDEDDYLEEEKREKKKNRGLLLLLLGLLAALTITSVVGYNFLTGLSEQRKTQGEQTQAVIVPQVVGMTQDRAKLELSNSQLVMKIAGTENSDGPGGVVLRVTPEAGAELRKGDTVNVVLSALKESVKVPQFTGKTLEEIQQLITEAGLTVGNVTEAFSPTVLAGKVLSLNPVAGSERSKGTPVDITVSKGIDPSTAVKKAKMPDITGLDLDEAKNLLAEYKLKTGNVTVIDNESPAMDGVVTDQSIPVDTEVNEGTKVNIVVANYVAPPATTPAATEPPATEPPATEPPATTKPAATSPATNSGYTPFDFDQMLGKDYYTAETLAKNNGYKISILNLHKIDGTKLTASEVSSLVNSGTVDAVVQEYSINGNSILVNVMANY